MSTNEIETLADKLTAGWTREDGAPPARDVIDGAGYYDLPRADYAALALAVSARIAAVQS